jgi:sulfite exporter TauE/SafE
MSSNSIAFFIGLFGSIHCIGMCGPLAFSIPVGENKWWLLVADKLLYNIGRVVTYSMLGLLVGFIGKQLWIYGFQQGVSLLSGLLIIIAGLTRLLKIRFSGNRLLSGLLLPVNKLLSYAFRHHSGHFIIGLINGLLPCGFVYLALAGALNTPTPVMAATFMFWFGVGTFPLMLLATISAGFIGPIVRRQINRVIPYVMVCLGFWFILRGLNLNIPYLSPAKQSSGISTCR